MVMEFINSMWNMTMMMVKFTSAKKYHIGSSWIGAIKRVYDEVYQVPPGGSDVVSNDLCDLFDYMSYMPCILILLLVSCP